jgi:hypothetical protein
MKKIVWKKIVLPDPPGRYPDVLWTKDGPVEIRRAPDHIYMPVEEDGELEQP